MFDESEASTSNHLLNCHRCKRWHHLKCLQVSNETQYLFKDAEFKFECVDCCGSADQFQAKMAEFKAKSECALTSGQLSDSVG